VDGHVEINPQSKAYLLENSRNSERKDFKKLTYDSMEQVIYEVLASYLQLVDNEDIFCVAMHELHTAILKRALRDKKNDSFLFWRAL